MEDVTAYRVRQSYGVVMGGWNIVDGNGRVTTLSDGTPRNFRTRDQARAELRHLRGLS